MSNQLEFEQNSTEIKPGESAIGNLDLSPVTLISAAKPIWRDRYHLGRITIFFISLYLFILAISLMRVGARGFIPRLGEWFAAANLANGLGLGWLFAYLIMSGSPVAAAALTFFDAGVINKLGAFAMITGSRLGASFIVLFIGFLYILRGRDRLTSLCMGSLSLSVTVTTYLPAFFIGLWLLNADTFSSFQIHSGTLLHSSIDLTVEPVINFAKDLLPNAVVFCLGLGIIMVSFNLFDKCLPKVTLKNSRMGWITHLLYQPVVMFVLGALVTFISMSVSLSLSLLVPLSSRGYVRREHIIPYIMGANITTFVDTLLASVLLNNPPAFTIVFVEMISVTIISIIILVAFLNPYQRAMLNFVNWVTASNGNLAIFTITILSIPAILILL